MNEVLWDRIVERDIIHIVQSCALWIIYANMKNKKLQQAYKKLFVSVISYSQNSSPELAEAGITWIVTTGSGSSSLN